MGKCGKIVQLDSIPHSSSARLRKFHMVAALPDTTTFEVQLLMNGAIVGNGHYYKDVDGVAVLREYGACQGLPL